MPISLRDEFEHYVAHQADFVARYAGKVIVLKDKEVIGVYDDQLQALTETQKSHAIGTFLIQRVEPGAASHTQTFHSRVRFA
jgi:ABC-type phosphate/phosphonate transport system ATPase subunit